LNGRPLAADDCLPLALDRASEQGECRLDGFTLSRPARYRAILGPQDAYFTERAKRDLFEAEYTVKVESDRMALQLDGPKLEHLAGFDILSDGIAPGSIQVPGHGQPLVLMADRQTTGGYPKIATVISADLPALGRSRMGDKIAFEAISLEEAQNLRREHLRDIERIPGYVVPLTRPPEELAEFLSYSNLISGAVNALASID
jgi:allophanate hydrolase subunit 2